MTNLDLDNLEQLHAAATPGPWERRENDPMFADLVVAPNEPFGRHIPAEAHQPEDAEWIAAIHNAAPALIAELREARATIERVRAITDECGEPWDGEAFTLWRDTRAALAGEQ
jgi:hypothetical protein